MFKISKWNFGNFFLTDPYHAQGTYERNIPEIIPFSCQKAIMELFRQIHIIPLGYVKGTYLR